MDRRALVLCVLAACQPKPEPGAPTGTIASSGMVLASDAFADGAEIPTEYTCEGDDRSPPLRWSGVPAAARSLALTIVDPDVPDPAKPKRQWVHWVLVDLPPGDGALPEAVPTDSLPQGTREGKNDFERTTYGGPCPPIGRHRYIHTLYALDTTLPQLAAPTREELERAIDGHVLAQAQLIGTYQKKKTE